MRSFDLPLVAATVSADNALKTAIDAKRSGVVLKTKSGGLRLVHYKSLVSAARNKKAIGKVDYVELLKVGGKKTVGVKADKVKAAGLKFGYLGAKGAVAKLLSVRETFSARYEAPPDGRRCTRPDKPPDELDQDWYHYYPPEKPRNAKICVYCDTKII
jgi:hypothetical protein